MKTVRKDVDGGWAWIVLLASFTNLLLASGICFVAGIFQKLFLEEFGGSVAFTAWVTALFSSFMQLAGPLSGLLTSVTNCRVSVMAGRVLLATGLALSSLATSLTFLLVSFGMVGGLGLGLLYTPSIVIVNFFFDRRRTVIMGLAMSASGIGLIASPVLSRFLIDQFTWRETMVILAGISAQACVFGAVMFPMHEPNSRCLLLYRRCRPGGVQEGISDKERHPAVSAALDKRVSVPSHCAFLHQDGCGDVTSCPTSHKEGGSQQSFTGGKNNESDGDKTNDDMVEDLRRLINNPLQEKSNPPVYTTRTADIGRHTLNNSHDVLRPAESPTPVSPSRHQVEGRKSLDIPSHISRNEDSHRSGWQLSRSAHDIDRLSLSNQPDWVNNGSSPVFSLVSVQDGQSSKGSRVDLRAISAYSSIQSIYSIGGLPTVQKLLALSHNDQGGAGVQRDGGDGEGADGGGGAVHSDLMIFKNVPFLILCLNLFLSNMACGIYNIHLPAFCQQRDMDDHDITFILAMNGLAVFLSRILLGGLAHDDRVDKLAVFFGLHVLASFVQACLPFTTDLKGVTVCTLLVGNSLGSVYTLLAELTICVVGLPSLAFAFGVEMISAGLGFLVAPPLAGWLVDNTGNYNYSMYFGGGMLFLSALPLLCLSCIRPPGSPPIGYSPQSTEQDPTDVKDSRREGERGTV